MGSASCLSASTTCPFRPLLLLLPVLEPSHDAGEVQAPCQRVQEHLVLLDALNELLQGEFPWDREKRESGQGGCSLPSPWWDRGGGGELESYMGGSEPRLSG